eukprot:TRINITY_DN3367_c0_g1_i1.p1 TRINITY_DN3367_c0_g1~~TRINITY_DN3367_c0_g1_i1.p1  ORF type:complete len:479 (-),score=105.82 TRINITY_DN3367_c0_g1_i1:502-1938(-)
MMSAQRTMFLSICVLLLLLPAAASETDTSSIDSDAASVCSQNGETGSACSRSLLQSSAVRMSVKAKTSEAKSEPKSSKDRSSKVGSSKTVKTDEKASKTNRKASRIDSKPERKQVATVQGVGVDAKAKASPKVDSKNTVPESEDMEDHIDHKEHSAMTPGLVQEKTKNSLREQVEQNLSMLAQGFISNLLSIIFVVAGILVLVLAGLIVVQAQQHKGSGAQNYGQMQSSMSNRPSLASMSPSRSARSLRSPRPSENRPGGTTNLEAPEADTLSAHQDSIFLCPELIVPDMTECTLQVPHLQQSTQTKVQLSINDAKSCPVFRVEYFPIPHPDGTALVLSSPPGDLTFATLRIASRGALGSFTGGGSMELQIFSKKESKTAFGTISADGDGYKVATLKTGKVVKFEGKWMAERLSALDEQGQLLALSDPTTDGKNGEKRRDIRIGPLVDAGLMAVSFLGIDILNLQRSQTPSFSATRFG